MMITLRHADEVIAVDSLDPPNGGASSAKEKELAAKLIEALAGRFDPKAYHDQYQEKVRALIDAKRAGKKIKSKPVRRGPTKGSLANTSLEPRDGIGS